MKGTCLRVIACGVFAATFVTPAYAGQKFDDFLKSLQKPPGAQAPQEGVSLPASLDNLFLNAPFHSDQPVASQYPRVAFKVLSSPPRHGEMITIFFSQGMNNMMAHQCWDLSATVWRSKGASSDTGPFKVCVPEFFVRGVPLRGFEYWGADGTAALWKKQGQTSGDARTTGPNPPDTAFPKNIRYLSYYGSFPTTDTSEGVMWASLFYKMGFDWQNMDDRRAWVVKYAAVEGP